MCSGNDAFGFSEARTNATAKRAKRAVAAEQTLGADAKNGSSAIGRFACATLQHTAPADFVIWA